MFKINIICDNKTQSPSFKKYSSLPPATIALQLEYRVLLKWRDFNSCLFTSNLIDLWGYIKCKQSFCIAIDQFTSSFNISFFENYKTDFTLGFYFFILGSVLSLWEVISCNGFPSSICFSTFLVNIVILWGFHNLKRIFY